MKYSLNLKEAHDTIRERHTATQDATVVIPVES